MRDNGDSCKSTFVLKRKAAILSINYDILNHQRLSNILVDVMLNSWLLLIISCWIMLWNKAVFCLEVLIYKRLQMWRHIDVIGRNEYLISRLSESTIPFVYSLQFLFKCTHHTWRYERKCEWVFYSAINCIEKRRDLKLGNVELRLQCHCHNRLEKPPIATVVKSGDIQLTN